MASDEEEDVLNQEQIARNKLKEFMKSLTKSIEDYLEHKEDLKRYVMWDKVKQD